MNTTKTIALSGFWQKNGLGPLGVKYFGNFRRTPSIPIFTFKVAFVGWKFYTTGPNWLR